MDKTKKTWKTKKMYRNKHKYDSKVVQDVSYREYKLMNSFFLVVLNISYLICRIYIKYSYLFIQLFISNLTILSLFLYLTLFFTKWYTYIICSVFVVAKRLFVKLINTKKVICSLWYCMPRQSFKTGWTEKFSKCWSYIRRPVCILIHSSPLAFPCLRGMIHFSPLSLRSFPPPLNLISYPSHYVSPPSPILLPNRTHWPWLICCIWLNERSFTYLITMATGINDRWPLGRNTEVLKKKKLNWIC